MTNILYNLDGLKITDRFIYLDDGHGKCAIDVAEIAEVSLGPPETKNIDTYLMIAFQAVGFGSILYDNGIIGTCFLVISVISLIIVLLKLGVRSGIDVVTITLSGGTKRPLTSLGAPIEKLNEIYAAITKSIECNQWDDGYEDEEDDDGREVPF